MAGILQGTSVLLRTSHLEAHNVHLPFVGDANFVQRVKGVAGFLLPVVTIYLLRPISNLRGDNFETMKISCFLVKTISPPLLF